MGGILVFLCWDSVTSLFSGADVPILCVQDSLVCLWAFEESQISQGENVNIVSNGVKGCIVSANLYVPKGLGMLKGTLKAYGNPHVRSRIIQKRISAQ